MSAFEKRNAMGLYLGVAGLAAAIFLADLILPLGVAVWVLYFAPIALCFLAPRPSAPLVVAATCTLLIAIGFFTSADRGAVGATYSPVNRSFAFVSIWVTALIGRTFIKSRLAIQHEDWLKAAQNGLFARLQGEQTHRELGQQVLDFLSERLNAKVGAMYLAERDGSYRRFATHALDPRVAGAEVVLPGEGLVGQAAREKRVLEVADVPEKYLDVSSGTGSHRPQHLVIAPAEIDGKIQAVVELGFLSRPDSTRFELLSRVAEGIGTAVRSANYRTRQAELLEETQRQAEELQTQQEELRVQNEELEQQAQTLQHSQQRLENQQTELEQINGQLEEQMQALEQQRDELAKAEENLRRASTYKSDFLANMSHELRTPLNSSLILAKLLVDNREGTLTPEQVKFAQTIYSAGNDLLTLINDILDLSKIEAGKLDVRPESVTLARLLDELEDSFGPVAREKQLALSTEIEAEVPATISTDVTRLQQILRNLLSNALKFTERGGVTLSVRRVGADKVAFAVKDTGIGIPAEQHQVIFEAFRQADGTINRKFGGTGLGLSISRDLSRLLGGDLDLESAAGRGSTFTLTLPVESSAPATAVGSVSTLSSVPASGRKRVVSKQVRTARSLADDRSALEPSSPSILVIEDDQNFARIIQDLAHELEFQVVLAENAEDGLALAEQHRPSGIILDVGLPDRSGLSVLDALKHNSTTRHIPVHMVSVSDYAQTALSMGAAGYAIKPVKRDELVDALKRLERKFTQKLRRVLVVEDDATHRESTCRLLAADAVETVAVGSAAEALSELGNKTFDCLVLDLSLPDRSGFDLLEEMSQGVDRPFPPVIVYTGRSLSREEEQRLRRFSSSIIVKGARSPERLLDEVTLFLHQVESELPADRQRMLRDVRHREAVFEGKRVLVVEDDVRNIFALSSVLEPKGAKVEIARNGREALDHLFQKPGVDLVLMDIMMPEMDGLEATREIRKRSEYQKLPIIALTAKAMADDRETCLAAGANDYIAKPLDVDKLLSLARVWMPK